MKWTSHGLVMTGMAAIAFSLWRRVRHHGVEVEISGASGDMIFRGALDGLTVLAGLVGVVMVGSGLLLRRLTRDEHADGEPWKRLESSEEKRSA